MIIAALALLAGQPALDSSVMQKVGTAPTTAESIAAVEAAIKDKLKDPDSARFKWPYGFVAGSYKPILGRRIDGLVICGTINARNGYGGYTGQYAAIAVIDVSGTIEFTDIDEPGPYSAHAGWIADQCRKAGEPVL